MVFVATNKAPGVYIDEVQLPGAIAGVGTSTAAFVGPAMQGPLKRPVFLTNLTQFQNTFGGFITAPLVYVTHAVRGFFENGGALCYFVRVGTAAQASLALNDRAATARPTLVVTAKQEGVTGNAITVEVQDSSVVASVNALRAAATLSAASNNQATVTLAADAANFRPGDIVSLTQAANNERATIASISGTTIRFQANLTNTYTGGDIRIANLVPGQTVIRIAGITGIEPGSYVRITQGATNEARVVQSVEPANNVITLAQGLANTYTMAAADAAVTLGTSEFTIVIKPGAGTETYPNLSMDPRHSRYFARIVNSTSVDVTLADPPAPDPPPTNLPAVLAATALANGKDDDVSQIQTADYKAGIDTRSESTRSTSFVFPTEPIRTFRPTWWRIAKRCRTASRFSILLAMPLLRMES